MNAKENTKIKDSVFVDLFYSDESAEANERSLYEALHGEPIPEEAQIQRIRIENQIYMNFCNDVSFEVGGTVLIFGEHQSTINKNMPLRCLMHAGRAYEKLVEVRDRYKKELLKIPKPEFYTFYNGVAEWGKELTLKLSDAYKVDDGELYLEAKVKVININPAQQHELLERCPVLKEYGLFIDTIRKYQLQNDPESYKHAIMDCIANGILADYLKRKGSEVENMLTAEYDYDLDIEVQREEAMELGIKLGEQRSMQKIVCNLRNKGMTDEQIAEIVGEKPETIAGTFEK